MTIQQEREHRSIPNSTRVCTTCGGRGALRQGDESYRTCLECLGQGHLPGLEAATTTAAVLNKGSVLLQSAGRESTAMAVSDAATSAAR